MGGEGPQQERGGGGAKCPAFPSLSPGSHDFLEDAGRRKARVTRTCVHLGCPQPAMPGIHMPESFQGKNVCWETSGTEAV